MMKCDEKLEINRFVKKTRRKIYEIKNPRIWIKIRGEINKGSRWKFPNERITKTKIEIEID